MHNNHSNTRKCRQALVQLVVLQLVQAMVLKVLDNTLSRIRLQVQIVNNLLFPPRLPRSPAPQHRVMSPVNPTGNYQPPQQSGAYVPIAYPPRQDQWQHPLQSQQQPPQRSLAPPPSKRRQQLQFVWQCAVGSERKGLSCMHVCKWCTRSEMRHVWIAALDR